LLRNKFQKVVEKLPRVVYEKLGTLETDRAKFAAVASLINKHSGELVEPDLSIAYWRLVPVGPGFARWDWGEQFWCYEDGREAPSHFTATEHELHAKQWKPGHGGHLSVNKVMTTDITVIVRASKSKREDLLPAWDHMRFRHVCPCSNSERYAWIRSHSVVSLGEMLMILGEEHTLAEIYSLYRTLRVVVLKRRKDRCSASSGVLGRSSTGSSLSGMAGASVKRELKSSKDLLIEEYSTLMAQSLPDKNDGEGRETVQQGGAVHSCELAPRSFSAVDRSPVFPGSARKRCLVSVLEADICGVAGCDSGDAVRQSRYGKVVAKVSQRWPPFRCTGGAPSLHVLLHVAEW
jgi:hypothetical protein